MEQLDEQVEKLRRVISRLEWDIPNIVNKDILDHKVSRLESYRNELSRILKTGG